IRPSLSYEEKIRATRKDATRKDATRKDATRKDATRKDATRKDATRVDVDDDKALCCRLRRRLKTGCVMRERTRLLRRRPKTGCVMRERTRHLLRRLKTGCVMREKTWLRTSLAARILPNALLLFILFCSAFPAKAQSGDQQLRWGGDAEGGAPYLLPDPKNPREIIGFEIDLMNAI